MLQLTFNTGLTLPGFRTTRPWSFTSPDYYYFFNFKYIRYVLFIIDRQGEISPSKVQTESGGVFGSKKNWAGVCGQETMRSLGTAPSPKPLLYLRPKSAIFPILSITWTKIWFMVQTFLIFSSLFQTDVNVKGIVKGFCWSVLPIMKKSSFF